MLLLLIVFLSGLAFAAVEREGDWPILWICSQVLLAGIAVGLHIRLTAVARWIDTRARRFDQWRPGKR